MTDYPEDTPVRTTDWCRVCEPDRDPIAEPLLNEQLCANHQPDRAGSADDVVTSSAYLSGSAEAGGDDNRRWCALIHGTAAALLALALSGCVTPPRPPVYICYPAHLSSHAEDDSVVGVCLPFDEGDVSLSDIKEKARSLRQ